MSWIVLNFNRVSLLGKLWNTLDGQTLLFHSTDFESDTQTRWPEPGEPVQVIFNHNNQLLAVHGK